jgi:hypothetical protein
MNHNRDGLFEKTPGSGFWWVLWRDHKGVLRTMPVGDKATAKAVLKVLRIKVRAQRLPPEAWAAVFGDGK